MASENHPPSINNLLDQGFDLQYFNPPAEYPIPLENDWYAQFIKGEIRVVNPPPKEPKKGKVLGVLGLLESERGLDFKGILRFRNIL